MSPRAKLFGRFAVILLAYFLTGKLGLLVPYVSTHITLIWLPTGIAVASLMNWGLRYWPAVFVASLLLNLCNFSPLMAACIAVGNTLGPVLTTLILRRLQFRAQLPRIQDIAIAVMAACTGMLLSASGGVASLVQAGMLVRSEALHSWVVWWLADTVGVLLMLPLLFSVSKSELQQFWHQRYRYLGWCAVVSVSEMAIFSLVSGAAEQLSLLAFLVMPLVIWTAMRFGNIGASLAVFGLSMIAVVATSLGYGPFHQVDAQQGIVALWVFMCTLTLVVLMITVLQSQRALTEQELRGSQAKLRAVIDGALDAVVTIDAEGRLVEFNPAAERIFGHARADVMGKTLAEVIVPSYLREAHNKGHRQFIQTGEKHIFDRRLEMVAVHADGHEFPVEVTITSLHDKGLPLVTGFIRDITRRKQAEESIRNLAFFDALTGLPNRRLLLDRMQQALATSARSLTYGAVLFIDLDNFKALNDTRGHDVGDLLLVEVAKRIRQGVRAQDTVSRLGGDEFVVALEDLSMDAQQAASEARQVGEKILSEINRAYTLQEQEHHSSSSLGMCLFKGYDVGLDELLKRADTAMYQAKASGRNTLRFFDPAMQAAIEGKVALELQLRHALMEQQLLLHYQPQVDADRRVLGVEALLRWQHPLRGMVGPVEFIPIAEEGGLIIPIGNWVMMCACEQLKRWESMVHAEHLQMAVNVSARQFRQVDFVDEVKRALQISGANPNLLKLELTESLVIDDIYDTVEKMGALRLLGVRFSMDDFGTGYSSLAYLKQLPLTQVKIDQSFVRDIVLDASDATIVQTIIVMSNTLGLNVIAEGVETEGQFALLKQYGCHQFQGYLFSRPLALPALEQLLVENHLSFKSDSGENRGLAG